jgi:hypothetical protein
MAYPRQNRTPNGRDLDVSSFGKGHLTYNQRLCMKIGAAIAQKRLHVKPRDVSASQHDDHVLAAIARKDVIKTPASRTDRSSASAKVLNFDSAGGSPESPGEKPTDDNAVGEAQTNGAENVESEEDPEGDGKESEKDTIIEQEGGLCGATLSDADRLLRMVYGDYVHHNSGQHLNGGVEDDQQWQDHWQWLIVYPSLTYNAPLGAVGCCFIEKLDALLDGVWTCKLNAEKFIVFHIVFCAAFTRCEASKKHQEMNLKAN